MVLADRLVVSGYAETKVAFILAQLVCLGMFFQAGQFQKEACAAVGEINQRERAVRRLFPGDVLSVPTLFRRKRYCVPDW